MGSNLVVCEYHKEKYVVVHLLYACKSLFVRSQLALLPVLEPVVPYAAVMQESPDRQRSPPPQTARNLWLLEPVFHLQSAYLEVFCPYTVRQTLSLELICESAFRRKGRKQPAPR